MSDGHTGMGRKRPALLPGNSHIPLIHHEYREREGGREGLRERERDEGSVPVIRPAGMPVQLGYFKVAYAIRVRLSRGAQCMKSNASCSSADVCTLPASDVSVEGVDPQVSRSARRLGQWVSVVR